MGDVKSFKMFIGGEWTDASDGNKREIVSPAHGEVIAEVPEGTAADVDRAVKAAKKAYEETWSDATPGERSRALLKMADLVEEHGDEIGKLESENVGKVHALTMTEEIPVIADQFRFFASGARVLEGLAAGEYMKGVHEHAAARADRRGRAHRAVELPAVHGHVEARPGARGRQHGRDQARREHAAHAPEVRAAGSRRPKSSRRACSTS